MSHNSILTEAEGLVHGDRNEDYGHPLDDFSRTAKMWSAMLGIEVTAEQVGLCMMAVKMSRECNRPKRDNLVDAAGYAETVQWLKDERERRAQIQVGENGMEKYHSALAILEDDTPAQTFGLLGDIADDTGINNEKASEEHF